MSTRRAEEPPLWRQLQDRCVHFSGLLNDTCDVGVRYADVEVERDPSPRESSRRSRLPCLQPDPIEQGDRPDTCPHVHFLTDEEAQAEELAIRERFARFWEDIEAGRCPYHHTPMVKRQVGRCVYAAPCGCRLYQGRLAPTQRGRS